MKKYPIYLLISLLLPSVFLGSCGEDRSGEYYALIAAKTWIYETMQQNYLFYEDLPAEDNIDFFKIAFQIRNIRLHQFGLTRSTNTRDDLDVRSAIQFNDSIEIFCSRDCFHIVTRFQKLKFFHFSKPLRCTYYTVC